MQPLGFFDSGFWWLTVLAEFRKLFPQYDYLYLADAARVPYGDRSAAEILQYTTESVAWLFSQGCPLVIIACNTATAYSIQDLQQRIFPYQKVLSVTVPAAEKIYESGWKKVGVLATTKTVENHTYQKRVALLDPSIVIQEVACPSLVPLLEAGKIATPETEAEIKKYLAQLDADIEAIALGCTHYHVLEEQIAHLSGKPLVHSGRESATRFVSYLARHQDIQNSISQQGKFLCVTTGDVQHFRAIAPFFVPGFSPFQEVLQVCL